ncbi:cellulose synthase regulator protein [Legionella gratiana]|uniref:Cyclic di-GMP-binding protein n=1 Tax=Legionella gratiana TaxID=45066 RepID=A0A378J2C4_9GAMM|nr:cellulose biosynthesis cyclic di-GMP-binding regulatory protein BcsB [Legionella gratiana]KTD14625.1 cellulose synthase regulator protein [Legionella gratiana]STX41679.1 cellulose synthase regulator protein [Legionella gratiana]
MHTKIFKIIILLFSVTLSCAQTGQGDSNFTNSQTYTLYQLSKINTAVIKGQNPSYSFYIPIPAQWSMNSLDLNFVIQFSPILLSSSTLTVMVENVPLDTIKLTAEKQQAFFWKVTVPKKLLEKKITTIRVVGYLKISEDPCQDMENEGNWLTISGNSTVTYNFNQINKPLDLARFPYPFIQKDSPIKDKISFILPNPLNAETIGPYLKTANILSKKASWRGVSFDFAGQGKGNIFPSTPYNAILIAMPSDFDFNQIKLEVPFELKNNIWYTDNGTPLANNRGLIFLVPYPKQPEQALLIVTANSQEGINTALNSLSNNVLNFTANTDSYYIAGIPEDPFDNKLSKPSLSFADMGYLDNVVYGDGQQTITYQFDLPKEFINEPVKLVLTYNHSPFLDPDHSSYLMVRLNDLPLDGVKLLSDDAKKSIIEIVLPSKQLKPGKNKLDVIFDLRLPDKYCSQNYLSLAWGTIYNDSYLSFTPNKALGDLRIKYYPYLMDNQVTIGLPQNAKTYENKKLLLELIKFATSFKNSSEISVVKNTQLGDSYIDGNVVYLGTGKEKSPFLQELKTTFTDMTEHLNLTSNNTLKSIDKNLFLNAFDKNQNIGFVGITKDTENSIHLILFGYTPTELELALALMNDQYKRDNLHGNIAVSFQNGSYTSLSSEEINQQIEKELKLKKSGQITFYIVLFVLGGLTLLGLTWFILRGIRNK